MIQGTQELQQWFKKLTPQEVFEDLEFNEVILKYYQGSNKFEGEYKGKVIDTLSGKTFLFFLHKKKALLYDNKDLTVGQWNELMQLPGYEQ